MLHFRWRLTDSSSTKWSFFHWGIPRKILIHRLRATWADHKRCKSRWGDLSTLLYIYIHSSNPFCMYPLILSRIPNLLRLIHFPCNQSQRVSITHSVRRLIIETGFCDSFIRKRRWRAKSCNYKKETKSIITRKANNGRGSLSTMDSIKNK